MIVSDRDSSKEQDRLLVTAMRVALLRAGGADASEILAQFRRALERMGCPEAAGLQVQAKPVIETHQSSPVERWCDRLLQEAGPYALHAALLEERARLGTWYRVADFVGDVLEDLGSRWARDECSVIDEHAASHHLTTVLDQVAAVIAVAAGAPRCVLATAEGDTHSLGLSLAEIAAREAGWECLWVGSPITLDELTNGLPADCQLLAVSASSASCDADELSRQAGIMADACGARGIRLVLGGSGAWPDKPSYGVRLRSFEEFHDVLVDLHTDLVAQ